MQKDSGSESDLLLSDFKENDDKKDDLFEDYVDDSITETKEHK